MGIFTDGSKYGITQGLMYSMPCTCANGEWSVVEGKEVSSFSREKMAATEQELVEERDLAKTLIG